MSTLCLNLIAAESPAPILTFNGEWPTAGIPIAELRAMAAYRDEIAREHELAGNNAERDRHWRKAEFYRDLIDEARA